MDLDHLLQQMAHQEEEFSRTSFVAPAVPGTKVRVRLGGLVAEYAVSPDDFEGWGVFQLDQGLARLQRPASQALVEGYLKLLPQLRLILTAPLQGRSWLAFPSNRGDARQRLGGWGPQLVSLTRKGQAFESVVGAWDGGRFWYAGEDRGTDPRHAERLRQAIREETYPEHLGWSGLTPEMREAYAALVKRLGEFGSRRDERLLGEALQTGGGRLLGFVDHQDHWTVEWRDSTGVTHRSGISKDQLTVISSGICLSGRDRDFDLQSLVGVVENFDEW